MKNKKCHKNLIWSFCSSYGKHKDLIIMLSPVGSIAKQNIHGKKVLLLCKIGLGDHLEQKCKVECTVWIK